MINVYLSGHISGLSYSDACHWRNVIKNEAYMKGHHHLRFLDPMRNKEHLRDTECIKSLGLPSHCYKRDKVDVKNSDALIVNLDVAPDRVSIGSIAEVSWAHILGIPVILVYDYDEENVNAHPFVHLEAYRIVKTIEEALDLVVDLFPG